MLLTRFVPFATLSHAQTAPSPSGTALQVKLMLDRRLRRLEEKEDFACTAKSKDSSKTE
jgi:hypothetical protein